MKYRKLFAVTLAGIMAASLAACSGGNSSSSGSTADSGSGAQMRKKRPVRMQ